MLRYCRDILLLMIAVGCSYQPQKLAVDVSADSTLTVSKSQPLADGADFVWVTLALKHFNGSAAAGMNVTFTINSNDVLVYQDTASGPLAVSPNTLLVTDAAGQIKTRLASLYPGLKTITTALVTSNQVIALRQASVTFQAPTLFPSLSLTASTPSPVAGVPFSVTATVALSGGEVATGYLGTLALTASDANAVFPSQITFDTADQGQKIVTGVIYKTAGSQALVATDLRRAARTYSLPLSIAAGPVAGFRMGIGAAVAGTPTDVSLTAVDAFNNIVTNYSGPVTLSASDPNNSNGAPALAGNVVATFAPADHGQVTLPGVLTLGRINNQVTLVATGQDPHGATVVSSHSGLSVSPGPPNGLRLVLGTSSVNVGASTSATATVVDAYGNTVPAYAGTVRLSATDPRATLPPPYTFNPNTDAGVHTFTVTLGSVASSTTVSVQDANNSKPSPGSASVAVTPVRPYFSAIWANNASAVSVAGAAQTLNITARDVQGQVRTGYNGTVVLSATDPSASLGAGQVTLSGGVGSASGVVLKKAGQQYVLLQDASDATLTGTSQALTVSAAAASTYVLSAGNAAAGTPTQVTITAQDPYGNVATGYLGTCQLTSSDPSASLPANHVFTATDQGVTVLPVTLKTAGNPNVTATDTVHASITGTVGVSVSPANTAALALVLSPSTTTAGTPVSATLTAQDAYGNTTPSYTGNVAWVTDNANAVLPTSPTSFTGKHGTVSLHNALTFYAAANNSNVSVIDAQNSTIRGAAQVHISPGAASRLLLTPPATRPTAGVGFSVSLAVSDVYGNTAGGTYAVQFSTSDPNNAGLPSPTLLTGRQDFNVTLFQAGAPVLNANALPSLTPASVVIPVQPASATSLVVTGLPSSSKAGQLLSFTVNARDPFGNSATGYQGTVHLTATDGAFTSTTYTFQSSDVGSKQFAPPAYTLTMHTAGTQTLTAQDSTGMSGNANILIVASDVTRLSITGLATNPSAGAVQNCNVTAYDTYGNLVTGYARTVTLSSSDHNASGLPTSVTYVPSTDAGSHNFTGISLHTAGPQSITASDGSLSATFNALVTANPVVDHLMITAPAAATMCSLLSPAVQVSVFDHYGNVVTQNTNSITIAAQNGNVFGTTVQPVQNGNALFNDLSLDTAGVNGLQATLTGSSMSAAAPFNVSGNANALSVSIDAISGTESCVDVTISVGACGAPVDLTLQYSFNGGPKSASLAPTSARGLYGLASTGPITLTWDSIRDVGHTTADANLVITARRSSGLGNSSSATQQINLTNAPMASQTYTRMLTGNVTGLATADLDHDGTAEVLGVDGAKVNVWHPKTAVLNTYDLGGAAPRSLAAADVNHDGNVDVVACGTTANGHSVYLLLGSASGNLQSAVQNRAFTDCMDILLADVDHNGAVDVITQIPNALGLAWAPAYTSGGATTATTPFSLGFTPAAGAVAGDFTGDGYVDVAVGSSSGTVGLAVGSGLGFGSVITSAPGGNGPFTFAAGDIDNNGALDVVAGNASGIAAYTQVTATGLGAAITNTSFASQVLALGDVDADGILDLLVATSNELQIRPGSSAQPGFTSVAWTVAGTPNAIALADVDRDGALDWVTGSGSTLGVWHNTTPTSCNPVMFAGVISTPTAAWPVGMAVADFNADGKYDVLVSHGANSNNLGELFLGDGATAVHLSKAYAVGGPAYGPPAAADLTGDGYPDVAVPVPSAGYIAVYAGDANGNLSSNGNYSVGPSPSQVIITDWNSDGHNDMLALTASPNVVTILLGPSFTPPITLAMGITATSITTGVFTSSGRPDLVAWNTNQIFVGTNNGTTGGFANGGLTLIGGVNTVQVVAADVIPDGFNDLLSTDASGQGNIYLRAGDGTGNFSGAVNFPANCTPGAITAAELDGNPGVDVAFLCTSQPTGVAVAFNQGNGSPARSTFVPLASLPAAVQARDMTSDGHPDLVVLAQDSNSVSLVIHNGQTGASTDFYGSNYSLATHNVGALLVDYNRDGRLDLITGSTTDTNIRLRLGATGWTFNVPSLIAAGTNPLELAMGDVDANGTPDLIVANASSGTFAYLSNNTSRGSGAPSAAATVVSAGAAVNDVALADVNNDGKLDAILATPGGIAVSLFSASAFVAPTTYRMSQGGSTALAIGDLDGDGWVDVVVTSTVNNTVSWLHNTAGAFDATGRETAVSGGPAGVAVGDLNNDGRPDVVVALATGSTTQVQSAINTGSQGPLPFSPSGIVDTTLHPSGSVVAQTITLSDVDHDGKLDALVPAPYDYGVVLLRGTGASPAFSVSPWTVSLGTAARNVAVGDLDNDGRPDLVVLDDAEGLLAPVLSR